MLKPKKDEYHKTKLNFNVLKVMLFKKKICPNCNHKLKRSDKKIWYEEGNQSIGGKDRGTNYTTFKNVDKYQIIIRYKCYSCESFFLLSDLAKKREINDK